MAAANVVVLNEIAAECHLFSQHCFVFVVDLPESVGFTPTGTSALSSSPSLSLFSFLACTHTHTHTHAKRDEHTAGRQQHK